MQKGLDTMGACPWDKFAGANDLYILAVLCILPEHQNVHQWPLYTGCMHTVDSGVPCSLQLSIGSWRAAAAAC